jgi:DNA-binding LacI/PurR family transcriptional regulator
LDTVDAVTVRLVDVATAAHVSVTTASRALGGFDDVAAATRRHIEETARRLGYVPNISAQRLRRQRTDMIGLILPADEFGFAEPFFNEFLAGVGEAAAALDRHLLMAAHQAGSVGEQETYLKVVRGGWVDGVILTRLRWDDARVELLLERGFHFVAFGRTGRDNSFPLIDEDSVAGLRVLVDHLVGLGHRRIAFVAGPEELTFARLRLLGFREAMTAHHLAIPDELVEIGDLRRDSGAAAMAHLLDLTRPPTAVIFANDMMALGGMEEAQARGMPVGEEVSVAGFDGITAGAHTTPGLTTLRQPIQQIGAQACRLLVESLDNEHRTNRHLLLVPELVVRGSTGCPPTAGGCTGARRESFRHLQRRRER